MPATDSPALVVARFLKSNNYTESYDAFVAEAGLEPDAGVVAKGDLTIEKLLEEKRAWDVTVGFEKLGVQDDEEGKREGWWSLPAPAVAEKVTSLPSTSNILSVSAEKLRMGDGEASSSLLFVSTADRRLHVVYPTSKTLHSSLTGLQDAPILACAVYKEQHLLTTSMSGQVLLSNLQGRTLDKRRDHTKYVVKAAIYQHSTDAIIATAGWDGKIILYRPTAAPASNDLQLGEPTATITLPTKPESMIFIQHPDSGQPVLVVSRTDSSNLYYYSAEAEPRLLGQQNLAPYSNAWVAFTPSALALCPTDPSLLAIGTSTVPSMKLLIVRLLAPPYDDEDKGVPIPHQTTPLRTSLLDNHGSGDTETQASQARVALAVAEREHAAIQIHCSTMAPQTAYSTPAVAWRPDGTGVWVNGDDGGVRGIEARSGKVMATLHGHDVGSKVRCLWAGEVEDEDGVGREMLVSGGFDQNLIVWTPPASASS